MTARIHRTPAAFANALSEAALEGELINIAKHCDSQGKRMSIDPTTLISARYVYYPIEVAKRPYIVAVSGGRDYQDWEKVWATLDRIHAARPIDMLIQGGAKGADRAARKWADDRQVNCLNIPAKWDAQPDNPHWRYRAGPVRNWEMSQWRPALWIFFPGGSGTEDAFRTAKKYRIPRRRIL